MKMGWSFAKGVALAVLFGPVAGMAQEGAPAEIPRAVKLIEVGAAEDSRSRSFFGQIAARETVDLSFEVGGELVQFPAVEGQTVERGALVARLDLEPFERAVRRAELALEQAERDFSRVTTLAERDVAAEVRANDARTARDLAEVELADARAALEDATLTAPFDGLVASRLTAAFTNVEPGIPVVRLHDMSEVRVEIDVPERLLQQAGAAETLSFEARLAGRAAPVPLRLVEYQAQTESIGQTFTVTLALPGDVDTSGLIPGASATVVIRQQYQNGAPVLPATAVLAEADRSASVLVYEPAEDGTGIVRRVPVEIAVPQGDTFRVSGLEEGQQVVAAGAHLLSEGERVRPYTGLTVEE